jgi:hypothetical protein
MSFGNFLNGFARGLGEGVEAGEYIQGARDRKAQRKEGQRVFKEQQAKKAAGPAPAPAAGPAPAPAAAPPVGTAPPLVATTPPQAPPPQVPPRMPMMQAPPQEPAVAFSPAARIGVQGPAYDTQFPAGIAGQLGVAPQRFAGEEYPFAMY